MAVGEFRERGPLRKTRPRRRHWGLGAAPALPYPLESIREQSSLACAGNSGKGTEQGWANLKQCRRLEARLGQSSGGTGGAPGELSSAGTGRSHPGSPGRLQGLHIFPPTARFPRISEGMVLQRGAAPRRAGSRSNGPAPAPGDGPSSRESRPHPEGADPPGKPGCEYRTAERLLALLTHSQAAGESCSRDGFVPEVFGEGKTRLEQPRAGRAQSSEQRSEQGRRRRGRGGE